jgi:hypothetical protein
MEQQQSGIIHPFILDSIQRRLQEEQEGDVVGEQPAAEKRQRRHRLLICFAGHVNRPSVQCLVNVLSSSRENTHQVTELELL